MASERGRARASGCWGKGGWGCWGWHLLMVVADGQAPRQNFAAAIYYPLLPQLLQ